MANFEVVWAKVLRALKSGQTIKNWSRARGHTGGSFRVEHVGNSGIMVFGGNMTQPRTISRGDFEKVAAVWDDYNADRYSRAALTKLSQNTTYILSILHLML